MAAASRGALEPRDASEGCDSPGILFANPFEAAQQVREFSSCLLYTFYELTALPGHLIPSLKRFRAIAVPSTYVQEVFASQGIASKVIPHGADSSLWVPSKEPKLGDFIAVGYDHPRKNLDALVNAFEHASLDATLTLKVHGYAPDARRLSRPRVRLVLGQLPDQELASMVARHRWFVLPTRGEGFCVAALEAMAAGLPCILPDATGHLDYASTSNSLLLPTKRVPATSYADWFEPDFQALVQALRTARAMPSSAYDALSQAARATAEPYSWKRCVDSLLACLPSG